MELEKTEKMVDMFNNEKMSLRDIGVKFEMSKSTVQRRIVGGGYVLDKSLGIYVKKDNTSCETIENCNKENNVSCETIEQNETLNQQINKTNVSRETIETEIVNRTYGIPKDVDRALKIKAAIEDKNTVDIVRDALKAFVEEKYFKM